MSGRSPQPYDTKDMDRRRMPRWAWITLIVVALVVLIAVVVMLSGGGHPRPSHGGGDEDSPGSSMPTDHQPPEGFHE